METAMTKLDQDQLTQIVAAVLASLGQGQPAAPKASSRFLPKGTRAAPSDLAAKDAALINAFHRKGFKDVVLLDRTDPSKPHNIKPYKLWIAEGRVVRRGQKGVRGLFHITQTDPLPGKASAKPTAKKAKPQATLPLV
jgi:hypothetical protein